MQMHILSINGSIEAARAGEHGRAFATVANEMTHQVEITKEFAATIQHTVSEIKVAVNEVHLAIDDYRSKSEDQVSIIKDVHQMVDSLKHLMSNLQATLKE